MIGTVYLIGAGPGDYKLITVKGRECIEKADVIIYDYLADEKILRWARPGVELIYAGKKANQHTMQQEDINALIVNKALEGKTVARLKGGDPLVFGRGGEEALACQEAGVPFAFVPGVTSAIAAPAYAGIPVTHRAVATSFAIVTGHEDPTKPESGVNWEHLAKAVDTICFVMAIGNLPIITEKLIQYGRPKDMPAAVIRWGTKSSQEVLVSTLEKVAHDVAKAGIKAPAIFMVGDVIGLRDRLRWFDNQPLFGKTIVVTRARTQASQLVAKLEELGATVLEAPAIQTVPLPLTENEEEAFTNLKDYKWIVFTSAQGVEYFFSTMNKKGLDSRALGSAKICSIGSATAKSLKEYGLLTDLIPKNYQSESLVDAMGDKLEKGDKVLLIQPKVARSIIPDGLLSLGVDLTIVRLYETQQATEGLALLEDALARGVVDYVTFTSSSTVTNTLALLGERGKELLQKATIACIGPITGATCIEKGLTPDLIGDTFTIDALVAMIVEREAKYD